MPTEPGLSAARDPQAALPHLTCKSQDVAVLKRVLEQATTVLQDRMLHSTAAS